MQIHGIDRFGLRFCITNGPELALKRLAFQGVPGIQLNGGIGATKFSEISVDFVEIEQLKCVPEEFSAALSFGVGLFEFGENC